PVANTNTTDAAKNPRAILPSTSDKTSEALAKKSAVLPQKNGIKDTGEIYTVKSGEKLATIAKKLKISADDLMKLNKIDDPKKLQIGQKLHIPAKRSDL